MNYKKTPYVPDIKPVAIEEFADFLWSRLSSGWSYDFSFADPRTSDIPGYIITAVRCGYLTVICTRQGGGELFYFEVPDPYDVHPELTKPDFINSFTDYLKARGNTVWVDLVPKQLPAPTPIYVQTDIKRFIDRLYVMESATICADLKTKAPFHIRLQSIYGMALVVCNKFGGGAAFVHDLSCPQDPDHFEKELTRYLKSHGFNNEFYALWKN